MADETLNDGTIVAKKYKVVQKLGEGGCGSVYKVEDLEQPDTLHAMKIEFHSAQNGNVLKMEVQILQKLSKKNHVAKLIASGKKEKYAYMVMTLLGESLQNLIAKCNPVVNVSTQTRIGISVLFGIKQIHDIGYIHRDLKPANIALGYPGTSEERYFLLLDFGLSRQFVSEDNGKFAMKRPRERALFRGTARYCSIAMHDRSEQGRVDDLWALLYILAEMRCKLPWTDCGDKAEIAVFKRQTPDDLLLAKSPIQLLEFAKYLRTINYYDHPDYHKIYNIFNDIMKHADYKWSEPYHWEPHEKQKSKKTKKNSEKTKTKKMSVKLSVMPSNKSARKKVVEPKPPADAPLFTEEDFTSNPLGF